MPYENFETYRDDTIRHLERKKHISAQDVREKIEEVLKHEKASEQIKSYALRLKSDETFLTFFVKKYKEVL